MIQNDLEDGFEGCFAPATFSGMLGKKKNTRFISLLVRKHCKEYHPFLASHQIAISGSRPLTNTRPTHSHHQQTDDNDSIVENSAQKQRLIVGSPTTMADGCYSHDSHIVKFFQISDTTWIHSKTHNLLNIHTGNVK